MPGAPTPAALLDMQGVDKAFGGVPALRQARLSVNAGEVHALIGQNGAGKSTLIKVLTGAYARDAGNIRFDGRDIDFRMPSEAQSGGISTIYQELNLIGLRSVAENIFAGREPRNFGLIDWRRIEKESRALLARLGLKIDVNQPLRTFSTATQQMVAIARAVSTQAKLVIMDEPTSSLDDSEVETLFGVVRQLKADGVAVIFVSHRLDELYAVCDRITVMRDGQTVAEREMQGFGKYDLVASMLGKELSALQALSRERDLPTDEALGIEHLASGRRVRDASLGIRRGEIVGLAGLLGSGRTELARTVFGADRLDSGCIKLRGENVCFASPSEAILRGVAYLSEDRKTEGIIPDLSIRENLTLVLLPRLTRMGFVDQARQRQITDTFIKRLSIRCASPEQPIRELSGGNQQKVMLARWLAARIDVLLLDEPTRGIDVGAKAELLTLIRELSEADGLAVLMITSDLEELVYASDRVFVLRDGRTVAELTGDTLSVQHAMQAIAHGQVPVVAREESHG